MIRFTGISDPKPFPKLTTSKGPFQSPRIERALVPAEIILESSWPWDSLQLGRFLRRCDFKFLPSWGRQPFVDYCNHQWIWISKRTHRGRLTLRSLSHPSPPSPGSMWGTGYYHWLNSQTQVGNGSPHELYLSTTGMHSKNQAVIAPYQRCFGSWHSSGVLLFWVVGRDMKWAVCRQVRQLHVHPGRSPCLNVRWQKEIKRVDLLKWCQLMLTPPKGRCLCSFSVLSNVFQVSSVQCPVCGMILLFEYTIAKGGKKAWTKQLNYITLNSYWNGDNDQMDLPPWTARWVYPASGNWELNIWVLLREAKNLTTCLTLWQ